jgi:hypothetical protein
VSSEVLIDYARPCMMSEIALKDVHNFMLNKKYDEAIVATTRALQHIGELVVAINHEKSEARG